jgi:excisionase family DNA binding protein
MIDLSAELRAALLTSEVRAVLAELVAEAVAKALSGFSLMDDLLDVDGAAVVLRMTPGALRQAVARGTIPAIRIGRRLRFRRADLLRGRK